jgi:hypothetical protein
LKFAITFSFVINGASFYAGTGGGSEAPTFAWKYAFDVKPIPGANRLPGKALMATL